MEESTFPAWRDWKEVALEVTTWDAQTGAAMGQFTTADESLRAAYARKLFRFRRDQTQMFALGLGLIMCTGGALQLFDVVDPNGSSERVVSAPSG